MGQTVNLLVFTFGGSNPSLPTKSGASESCTVKKRGDKFRKMMHNAEVAQLIEH